MMQYHWRSHDIKVIFGDLNFRIKMNKDQVNDLSRKKDIKQLLKHDEWTQWKAKTE